MHGSPCRLKTDMPLQVVAMLVVAEIASSRSVPKEIKVGMAMVSQLPLTGAKQGLTKGRVKGGATRQSN